MSVRSSGRGSRYEYEPTDTPCPQGCTDTDPCGRGLRRVTHRTGEQRVVDVPGYDSEVVERVEHYLKCPVCGWRADA